MAAEIRAIPGFPGYLADDRGAVYSEKWTRSVRRLAVQTDKDGYRRVCLLHEGKRRCVGSHVLVLLAFVGPRPAGAQARHIDGNPANNALENLAWGTPQGNQLDRRRHGTDPRGEPRV